MQKDILTIAIVTRNCLEYTKLLLESLQNKSDLLFRLVVVDNASVDGTREFLQKQRNLISILNKVNLGFGPANNQVFKRAKTKYFLGLNNDTVVFPGFLKSLLDVAETHIEYAELGLASNCIGAKNPETGKLIDDEIKLLGDNITPSETIKRYYGDAKKFFKGFCKSNPGVHKLEVPPHFTGGWAFLVNVEAVNKVGGLFDRQFRVGFWEDVDLSWRLAKAGYNIGHINEIYLHHFTHVSFNSNKLRQSDKQISRTNALKFAAKWSEIIKNYLKQQLESGNTVEQISRQIHIFGVFLGRDREDYEDLEKSLRKDFIEGSMNFRDFLLKDRKVKI